MTSDFRYHVASLSAVFLALGIGILVGTAFVGTKVVDRQTAAVDRLTKETVELRKETREREQTEQMLFDALPLLVGQALAAKPVMVIQVGASSVAADQAQKALELAGATVKRTTLPDNWEMFLSQSFPELVVFAGGETEELARTRDSAVFKALREGQSRVVAVELYETPVSLVSLWSTQTDATVDCMDRATGWLALIVTLRGESGSFGLKTGTHLVPLALLASPAPTPSPSPSPTP